MKEGTVSIIMPAYNAEKYIHMSIVSAVQQTYEPTELIIVDDGSTDSTLEIICADAATRPDKIKWAAREKNGGTAAALNDAIELAEGEYICWLSADDLYAEDMVESEVAFLKQHTQYDAVFSRCAFINEHNQIIGEMTYTDIRGDFIKKGMPGIVSLLLYGNFWHGCTLLAKAACFKEGKRFDPGYRCSQDYDFWLRLAADHDIGYLDRINVYSREHSEQGSKKMNCNLDEIVVFFNTLCCEEVIRKLLAKMHLDHTFENIKPYILNRIHNYQNKEEELKTLNNGLAKYIKQIEDGKIHFDNR